MRLQYFLLPEDDFALVVDNVPAEMGPDIGKVREALERFQKDCGARALLVSTVEVELA